MKLMAKVRRGTGRTRHSIGRWQDDGPVLDSEFAPAAQVEIEQGESGFYLLRYDSGGEFAGDTWHETIEEAKEQAKYEYEIPFDAWESVEEGDCGTP